MLCVLGSTSMAAGLRLLAACLEVGVASLDRLIVSSTFPVADSWDPQNQVYAAMASAIGNLMPPTAGGVIARLAVARLIANGVDPTPILRQSHLSIDQIADPHARIAASSQIAVLNIAAEVLRDDVLGFRLARSF